MTFYRGILIACVAGNVALFIGFMRNNSVAWGATEVLIGGVFPSIPIIVTALVADSAARTLRGHWLNFGNALNPVLVGGLGLLAYGVVARPGGNPIVYFWVPTLLGILAMLIMSIVFILFIFVRIPSRDMENSVSSPADVQ